MSLHSYRVSLELAGQDLPFSALIMAAMRKADTENQIILKYAYPEIWTELEARYNAPGGALDDERRESDDYGVWPSSR
jgi:hypothetical protein